MWEWYDGVVWSVGYLTTWLIGVWCVVQVVAIVVNLVRSVWNRP